MKSYTQHAMNRMQQRGIREESAYLVVTYGTRKRSGGAMSYLMDKAARKRAENSPDRELYRKCADRLNIYVVVSYDEAVVTVAHSYRRFRPGWRSRHKPWRGI